MLVRGLRRLVLVVAPLFVFFLGLHFYNPSLAPLPRPVGKFLESAYGKAKSHGGNATADSDGHSFQDEGYYPKVSNNDDWVDLELEKGSSWNGQNGQDGHSAGEEAHAGHGAEVKQEPGLDLEQQAGTNAHTHPADLSVDANLYTEIFSLSTPDRKYFPILFDGKPTINPNMIPHPTLPLTWIITARLFDRLDDPATNRAISCSASFKQHTLSCISPPTPLPIAPTRNLGENLCLGKYEVLNLNSGPHDTRMFYGPSAPFVTYGSNSLYTCFGQWLQDLRALTAWPSPAVPPITYSAGTELQRPQPFAPVEKNWFLFWDNKEEAHVHYDVVPQRVFAKLGVDGAVGPDLGAATADADAKCMDAYGPKAAAKLEGVHQATNSLWITMCKRSDKGCVPGDENTFVMTVFQHKSFYAFHAEYEPYVMLFSRVSPFGVHAIAKKPFWVHGRGRETQGKRDEQQGPKGGPTEMFYMTSMSWMGQEQRLQGYLDDVLFVGFGIEDERTGGVDVVAGDLLKEMGVCASL